MSAVIKALMIALSMNICLTIVGLTLGGNDIISQFVTINNEQITPTSQFNLGGNESTIPTSMAGSSGSFVASSTGLSFIDTVKLTFKFLVLILVGVFLPIFWGFVLGLPLWMSLLLLLQTIFGVVAVILAIRGVSA